MPLSLRSAAVSCMDEGMRDFARRYRFSLDDPDLRRMYEYELSAKRDQASREYYAKEEGRAEGIAEGRAEGRAEGIAEGRAKGIAEGRAKGIAEERARSITHTVRSMLHSGISTTIIYNCVDASHEEVDAIIAKIRSGELHG